MADFDETSGVVVVDTPWGSWYQTIDEVVLLCKLDPPRRAREVKVTALATRLTVRVGEVTLVHGDLHGLVVADELVWTIEDDGTLLRIVLEKSQRDAGATWPALLKDGSFSAPADLLDATQKKMTLERFQRENPGFDFSNADVTGNYQQGGPQFPTPPS